MSRSMVPRSSSVARMRNRALRWATSSAVGSASWLSSLIRTVLRPSQVMRMLLSLVGASLAVLCALTLQEASPSSASPEAPFTPPESASVLGRVQILRTGDLSYALRSQYVFVRGARVTGAQVLWYEGGRLYLGRHQVHPALPSTEVRNSPKSSRVPSPRLVARLSSVPHVVRLHAGGIELSEAAEVYLSDVEAMLKRVSRGYRDALAAGRAGAEQEAIRLLDTTLVVMNGPTADLPHFEPCGGFTVQLKGYTRVGVACGEALATTSAAPLSEGEAAARAKLIMNYLASSGPTVILIGSSGNLFLTGSEQAQKAIDEIDRMLTSSDLAGTIPEKRDVVIPFSIRAEILAERARGSK